MELGLSVTHIEISITRIIAMRVEEYF